MAHPSASRLSPGLLAAACILFAMPALAASQARIVRLSDVQGSVQIDKNTGLGFENAFLNLPITQGTQLRTGDRGRAEIEFEDGSSMRLAPNTSIDFSTLGLSDSGSRVSQVNLTGGMAYVNWLGKSGDQFGLSFSQEKLSLNQPAHFRVNATPETATLAVFKGDVDAEGPAGKVVVEKKKTATFDLSQDDKYTLADKIADAPLDSWDKEASAYHDQYAKNNSSPYGYGASDLNYYGSYTSVPGYGMMWQPYFAGVGWDPFMDGAWGWYPGFGYMFASAYPWGWLPYRYGNWAFIPGMGWMWQPGGWNTWQTIPHYTARTGHFTSLVPPATGTVKTVTIGHGGSVSPKPSSFLFVKSGSAGIGIPRGVVENLSHLNHQVAKNGFAEVRAMSHISGSSSTGQSSYSSSHSAMASPSTAHASSVGHASGGGGHH
ncbi:MAG: FecR family protein [Candidatus Sulfotelmatobacter sp.]|jgi:hypothetical protein